MKPLFILSPLLAIASCSTPTPQPTTPPVVQPAVTVESKAAEWQKFWQAKEAALASGPNQGAEPWQKIQAWKAYVRRYWDGYQAHQGPLNAAAFAAAVNQAEGAL